MRVPIAAVVLLTLCAPAGATTLIPTDVPEMSREARAIALGHVVEIQARWAGDRRRIETLVTLEAQSYLKGDLGPRVQFLVPGGEIGRFRSLVVGAPHLKVGQRIVVFLGARGPGIPYIIGFNQGLMRVSSENGESIVRLPAGLELPDRGGVSRAMRVDDFARRVRALAVVRP